MTSREPKYKVGDIVDWYRYKRSGKLGEIIPCEVTEVRYKKKFRPFLDFYIIYELKNGKVTRNSRDWSAYESELEPNKILEREIKLKKLLKNK